MRLGQEQDIPSAGPRPRKDAVEKCPLWEPALRRWHYRDSSSRRWRCNSHDGKNAPSRHHPQEKSDLLILRARHVENLEYLVAIMVYYLHCDFSGLGRHEWSADRAEKCRPGVLVDLRSQGALEFFIRFVAAEEVCVANEEA